MRLTLDEELSEKIFKDASVARKALTVMGLKIRDLEKLNIKESDYFSAQD